MDSISESTTSLADSAPDAADLDAVMQYGFGADGLLGTPSNMPEPSTAFAMAPTRSALARPTTSPPTLMQRFENLSQAEQAAVLAIGAALLLAGIGWAFGLGVTKAASIGAAAL